MKLLRLLILPLLLLSNVNAAIGHFPDSKKIEWFTGPLDEKKGTTEQYKFSKDGKVLSYDAIGKDKKFLLQIKFENNVISSIKFNNVEMKFKNGRVCSYSNHKINTDLDVEWDDKNNLVNLTGTFEGKPSARAYATDDEATVGNIDLNKEFKTATKIGKDLAVQGLLMYGMLSKEQ